MYISLVILTCNQRRLTMRCLKSLTGFTGMGREIVLVDNGSTDGTADEVRRRFPDVQVLVSKNNLGVAAGRNLGLSVCSGKFLMVLDNDTIASASTIEAMATYLAAHNDVGVLAPCLVSPGGLVQESFKDYPGLGLKLRNLLRGRRSDGLIERGSLTVCEPFYVIGAAQMFSRKVYEQAGPYDNRIFYGPEDADFCMAVRAAGKRVVYNPEFVIVHDWQRQTNAKPLSKIGRKHIKALFYFYNKHRRWF